MINRKIARSMNYRKSKANLTKAEKKKQKILRIEYMDSVKKFKKSAQ